jgi:nitrilase
LRVSAIPERFSFRSRYPEGREYVNSGNSCIVAPTGTPLAGPLVETEDLLLADIDTSQIASVKRMFDAAGHYARPDVFDFAVRTSG